MDKFVVKRSTRLVAYKATGHAVCAFELEKGTSIKEDSYCSSCDDC